MDNLPPAGQKEPIEEKPIEIGSLDQKTSSAPTPPESTATLPETINSSLPRGPKKFKNISAIVGLIIIIVALPLTVFLVKQRQEIRKEAAGQKSGSVSFCGITISPGSHSYQNGTYRFNYSIKNNSSESKTVEIHTYGCACRQGNLSKCGHNSGSCKGRSQTVNIPGGGVHNGTVTARQPDGSDCGTFQADVFVLSVNGNRECRNN